MLVSASILNKKYKTKELVEKINKTDVDYIHLDIMDGKFVENKTWVYSEILDILKKNSKKLDVHLMVNNPTKYINDYSMLNTSYITFHLEAIKNIDEIIDLVKNMGIKVGISIKPNTSFESVKPYLDKIDLVLVMSVEPGKEGQVFIPNVLDKIRELKEFKNNNNLNYIIEVDGGINDETSVLVKDAGADMVVSASYIHEDKMQDKINLIR